MSLINQVLKDLEKRRVERIEVADGPIDTIPRYTVAKSHSYLSTLLAALTILLLLIVLLFVWDRKAVLFPGYFQVQDASSLAVTTQTGVINKTAVTAADEAQNQALPIKRSETESVAAKKQLATNTSGNTAKASSSKASISTSSTGNKNQDKSDLMASLAINQKQNSIDPEEDGGTLDKIEKRTRPLTQQQQASLAFQKGYEALRKGKSRRAEVFLQEALLANSTHTESREMLAG